MTQPLENYNFLDDPEFQISLFSVLLDDDEFENLIAASWHEFDPSTPEEEVEIYPLEFRKWYITNKYDQFASENDEISDEHHLVYLLKPSVTTKDLDNLGLKADDSFYASDECYYIDDERIVIIQELFYTTELEWIALKDHMFSSFENMMRKCLNDNLGVPEEWIERVAVDDI